MFDPIRHVACTDKKENRIFFKYNKIQNGAVASHIWGKGFLIYEEMRIYITIYEEAVSHIWLCNCSFLNFLIHEENFFLSMWPGWSQTHTLGGGSLWYRTDCVLRGYPFYVPPRPAARQSFSYKWGDYMFIFDWGVCMTPQKATMDGMRTLTLFVSYRLLSPQFQSSLPSAALGIYLWSEEPTCTWSANFL